MKRLILFGIGANGPGEGWWVEFLTIERSRSSYRTFIEFGWSVCHFTRTDGPYLRVYGFNLPSPRLPWREEAAK